MTAVGFVLAAAIGSVLRFGVGSRLNQRVPVGTWAVNIVGAFLLGLLSGTGAETLTILGTGALGSLTTFSTLAHESVMLARRRHTVAACYLAVTLVSGVLAAALGLALAG